MKYISSVQGDNVEDTKFPQEVINRVQPVIKALEKGDAREINKQIALLAWEMCDKVFQNMIAPELADSHFSFIDSYINENFSIIELSDEVRGLILEGKVFHDYGKRYGTNLKAMREIATKVLGELG